MALEYKSIVPWGRTFGEYVRMFDLTEKDLTGKILGCGDGPASFNYELTGKGGKIISIDPIYRFSREQIQERINETFDTVMEQTKDNMDKFIWRDIPNLRELGRIRMNAMRDFIADFDRGKQEGRYVYGQLPDLPELSGPFDIALSSHLLFLYSDNLSYRFHEQAIQAMLDAAKEVRIFPLLDYNAV